MHISLYVSLIQLSVVLADKLDTTILGFVLDRRRGRVGRVGVQRGEQAVPPAPPDGLDAGLHGDAGGGQPGGGAGRAGLERVKYDGTRLHIGVLLPVALLAWIYAGPFLSLWIGDRLGYDAAREAPLMRLFLVAALPLVLSVPVQMAIGLNKIKVIALAALAGSLVNLPISCYLTRRLGVSGVIWGTVLTTLFSNLLVPGRLCLPRAEDRPADLPEADLDRAAWPGPPRWSRPPGPCGSRCRSPDAAAGLAHDAARRPPRAGERRLPRRLPARPRRPRRPRRAGRQAPAAVTHRSLAVTRSPRRSKARTGPRAANEKVRRAAVAMPPLVVTGQIPAALARCGGRAIPAMEQTLSIDTNVSFCQHAERCILASSPSIW